MNHTLDACPDCGGPAEQRVYMTPFVFDLVKCRCAGKKRINAAWRALKSKRREAANV